ncbi:glycosyltransferase family 2 protein [Halapricum salinum]|uniref:Glycosyltransferase family 2 protein n=1 Tax=Halapricum salinum TaxID=1457250 RepID=A0A4D6HEY6_9EURY|nr:glycosyltransferase family 2 protein [Halapricum salinum]QCC51728.1 glycosyltransferase family 2 protein [Halapricum salinum]
MDSTPRVACVVLNWNSYDDTANCLDSLLDVSYDNLDLILVDNGSTDGSGERLAESFPEVTTILNETNLGFGAGMNIGIERALDRGADYVVITNNDIVVENRELFSRLAGVMERSEEIGMLTPTVMEWPDTETVWFEQGYVDERSGNASHMQSHHSLPNLRFDPEIGDTSPFAEDGLLPNDYVPLCFAVIRAEVFDEIGLLPEDYFMYYEDIEFATKMRNHGYRIATDTESEVYHRVSGSSGGDQSPLAEYYTVRNRLLLVRRGSTYGLPAYLIYAWWVWVKFAYYVITRRWASLKALSLGAYDGLRGQSGQGRYP